MKRNFDKEEQEILDAIGSGKWEWVKPRKAELEHYSRIAKNTLLKMGAFSRVPGSSNTQK